MNSIPTTTMQTPSLHLSADVTGEPQIVGGQSGTFVAVHIGAALPPSELPWDPTMRTALTVYGYRPDDLVKLADILLEAAEQLRAAQASPAEASAA